jgi:hypothetical protein
MPRVWALIGSAGVRKSSTMRALTGVGKVSRALPHVLDLSFLNGSRRTIVHPNALQEINITSAFFIQTVLDSVEEVIVALRYENRRLGSASDYLTAFRRSGWTIAGYAMLGHNATLPGFADGIPIERASSTPSNSIAAQLRQAWGII